MSEEVKICPKCGHPMRREGNRRVCEYCGYTEPIIELVSYATPAQDEEYVQGGKRTSKMIYYPTNQKGARKAKEHASQILARLGLHDEQAKAIIEGAMRIYQKAVEKDIIKGRSINALIEGAIYAMIKKQGLPINLDRLAEAIAEIRKSKAKVSEQGARDDNRSFRALKKQVKSEILKNYNLLRTTIGGELFTPPVKGPNYIDKYCEELAISDDVKALAMEIYNIAKERRLTVGRNPSGIAAASIYVAAKILRRRDIQQRKVARQAGITEVTLRNRSRELERVICENVDEMERRLSEAVGYPIDLRGYCEQISKRKKKRAF